MGADTLLWDLVEAFSQTLQQSRGFGSEFRFPDKVGGTPAAAGPQAEAPGPGPQLPQLVLTMMTTSTTEYLSFVISYFQW
jgi:hypothetical protein